MTWHFITYERPRGGFVALGKHEPFVTGNFFTEPGDVHFALGQTADDALRQLKKEVLN